MILSISSHVDCSLRVMVAPSQGLAVLPVVEIPRGHHGVLRPSSLSTSPVHRGFSGESRNLLVTSLVGTFVLLRRVVFLGYMGMQTRVDVLRTLRKLFIVKMFPGVGSGFARVNCFLTVDDVLVPVVTVQIVFRARCDGPVLEILN